MIRFIPSYFPRIWGGRALASKLGRTLPDATSKIGESWDICDRPEGMSIVVDGVYAGMSLHDLWVQHRQEIFGSGFESLSSFPLMVKTIAPESVLSIQVHPHEASLSVFPGEEKNEFWYIADASPKAPVYAGFKPEFDLANLESTMRSGQISKQLQQFELSVGESLMIPSGLVHALGAPCIIYEIQQNSDTTYRLDDWQRLDEKGNPREIHFEQSLLCAQQAVLAPAPRPAGVGLLVSNPYFRIDELELNTGEELVLRDRLHFALVTVVEGVLGEAKKGDTFLLPALSPALQVEDGSVRLLVTQIPMGE